MTVEADIFTALKSIVNNRVYPLTFTQPSGGLPTWPAIRYTVISEVPFLDICSDNDEDTDELRVQFDAVSTTYAEMKSLERNIRNTMAALDPPWTLEIATETFDEETKTRRVQMDYIRHQSSDGGTSP